MKQLVLLVAVGGILLLMFGRVPAQDVPKEDGQKVFMDSKCSSCHSVASIGLKKKPNQKAPDLSAVGTKRDAKFVMNYLKKKEAINGAKHLIAFKGDDKDLALLASWLESMKAEQKNP